MIFHKHRLRLSIRTQLIALVLFVAMFSLLVLAIVTGVYFTSVLTDTRASKLEVIAELKSSQLNQLIDNYYFQAFQLSEKVALQKALTVRKAGNTSRSALHDAQQVMNQTLEASTSLAYARLYDLDFVLLASASNPYKTHNASQSTLDELFILETNSTPQGPSLPNGLLTNRGYLDGPILDGNTYFISLSLPIYANESILIPQQFLSGYLTVLLDLQTFNNSMFETSSTSEYSSINYILPVHPYDNLTDYTGFRYAFQNENLLGSDINRVFNKSDYYPAVNVFEKKVNLGSYVGIYNPFGTKVSLGYSMIDLGVAVWLVTVEQIQPEFEKPVTKLIKIMIGLCVGLAAFMCLITFPLAHYGVRPILKLQKATEEITDRRGLKRKKRRKHVNPFMSLHIMMRSNDSAKEVNEKNDSNNNQPSSHSTGSYSLTTSIRNSWNSSFHSPSSVESFSNSYTQDSINNPYIKPYHHNSSTPDYDGNKSVTPLPSLVKTKGLFFDELTELTEAFNVMTLELDRQYSNLEDRVRARTKELEAAKVQADMARQQAEKANEAKTVFIANISHELRTPLNGILGMASVAMSEHDIDKIQNSLELIFRSGELLLHILIQLLTFSKNQLDKSKLQKKNFLINEVALQIKSIFGKTAKDQDVNLIINLKPNLIRKLILYGDANRIIQVVMNLVSNSLKFTPENGTVRVLIQLLGPYDEERSKSENYEKVYIKGLENDADYYHVKPIISNNGDDDDDENTDDTNEVAETEVTHSSTDNSSIISNKTSSTVSTLKSSVYIRSLSELYKSQKCDIEYFNDDEFIKDSRSDDSHHKTKKCYKFDTIDSSSWVLRFSVTDTGTGIEKSLQDKIFEAFVQGDQTLSRSHGGTGLGLSICKQFAKMMHGTLTLDSTVGKGSTFTFTIPLPQVGEIILNNEELDEFSKDDFNEKYNLKKKKVKFDSDVQSIDISDVDCNNNKSANSKSSMNLANSYQSTPALGEAKQKSEPDVTDNKTYDKPELITRASTGTAHSYRSRKSDTSSAENILCDSSSTDSNPSGLKLLVAEDNLVNQEVVKRMLKLEGISNISMARDGRDAVQFIKESINSKDTPYDLVLMDVQMPNLDGLSATRIIREELGFTGPIVALTAFADVSNEKGCIDAGMSGFLSKPIRRNLLRNIIRQFCSKLDTPFENEESEKSSNNDSNER